MSYLGGGKLKLTVFANWYRSIAAICDLKTTRKEGVTSNVIMKYTRETNHLGRLDEDVVLPKE